MEQINLVCPFCDVCADFPDVNDKGIVCCPECGRDFDSALPERTHPALAALPPVATWSRVLKY